MQSVLRSAYGTAQDVTLEEIGMDRGKKVEKILAPVDSRDWEYLISEIPMSGRGRFWHERIDELRRWYADRDRDAA